MRGDMPEVSLTVAAVARRLGVAPATLRTWDRRYGLGPSEHSAGAHRRYSPEDVARLMTMRRLTLDGVAPSEAARSALGGQTTGGPSEAEVIDAYADAEIPADPEQLVGAARHGDPAAVRWLLARVHPRDPLEWFAALVRPAMTALSAEPTLENAGDSSCHRVEAAAYAELRSRTAALAARTADHRPLAALVVPAGASTDLEAHVLAAALASRGVRAAVLTGGGPEDLARAVLDVGIRALVVHVGDEDPPAARALVEALDGADGLAVFWQGRAPAPLDRDVHRVRSLAGACHEVVAFVS